MTQLAKVISIVAHPFAMITLLVVVLALRKQHGLAVAQSVLLVVVAVIVPIGVLMFRQVRRGRWSNADASNASERPVLFLVAFSGVMAAIGWLLLRDPHSFLTKGLLVIAAFLFLAVLLTRWIKLSLHVAFAALAASVLSLIGSWIGYMLIAVIPLIFWSRLALGHLRVTELALGLVLGALAGFVLVRL